MKILILGGTRFVGKKLTANLLQQGHQIDIISRQKPEAESINPKHYQADRKNVDSLSEILRGRQYDCVVDMINFSSSDSNIIKKLISSGVLKIPHYVHISTAYVYLPDGGLKINESQFSPHQYGLKIVDRPTVNYEEGKRLSEAYLVQQLADLDCALIRFPIIFGSDDYTSRFFYFLKEILNNQQVSIFNNNRRSSYIDSDDASKFIQWVIEKKLTGIFNAACEGDITELEFAKLQNKLSGKENLVIETSIKPLQLSPMFTPANLTLDCHKASATGFKFSKIEEKIQEHTLECMCLFKI